MRSSRTTQVPSTNPGNITHNYNLSFEIGTSHFHSSGERPNINANERDGSSARDSSEDQNGKSNDISHGENHEIRSGYSHSRMNSNGNPYGIRPENDCVNGIQGNNSLEFSPAEDAIGQPVKVDGKPKGKSPSPRKSEIADPTPVLLIHSEVVRYCKPEDINTTQKIQLMLQESYPPSSKNYKAINTSEKQLSR